ncbi:ring-infested erythrocyte surface antigen, putative [Perkinsus marinus ATCC 50983]|uniref:Ring-infested erythrocyte surface antigen, putative n=1 Tax=Perkinsus marinus (strain ATCC 50983 / TXsc) TaxID=423536 RepID=C5KTZ7_PERM5|nr:ring-infested erythrocyte surface antigen, putative [Perkinsus marinus ATCC 50983]EER12039.1 ring-infested erythrocyte surface antigen, putative [Perkinsus marinus ATCC 50983]|eukprot:XP_002780244.1 ring-infested erythrocyte surface antigen, putative [Perkinsus marinus ATCC 50983]
MIRDWAKDSDENRHRRGPISALPRIEDKNIEVDEKQRVENEVKKRLDNFVASDDFKKRLDAEKQKEKAKALEKAVLEIASEKRQLIAEFKSKLEEKQRSSDELEKIMEDNARRAKEEQQRLAAEAASRREERVRELRRIEMERNRRKRVEELQQEKTREGDEFIF